MSTTTIPAELVAPVRSGAYFDMHGSLDEAGALIESPGRESTVPLIDGCLDRVAGTRALLGVLGWAKLDVPVAVEVDLHEHGRALRGALNTQIEADDGHLESLAGRDAGDPDRKAAEGRVEALSGLLADVEGES